MILLSKYMHDRKEMKDELVLHERGTLLGTVKLTRLGANAQWIFTVDVWGYVSTRVMSLLQRGRKVI